MKKELATFFKTRSYSPVITAPILGAVFFAIIPYISLILLNSRNLVIASTCCGVIFIPWILSYLHNIHFLKIAGIWCFFVVASLLTMPKEWEGNPKLAFADHFLPGIALALIFSIMMITFLLRKRNRV